MIISSIRVECQVIGYVETSKHIKRMARQSYAGVIGGKNGY
jgi:hypothetical protein